MNLGEKLYNLRKDTGMSQEEVADKLNVTRQTVSKWETGESKPDFDKILPICELYDISTDELLGVSDKENDDSDDKSNTELKSDKIKRERALFLSIGIFLYFLAVVSVIFFTEIGIGGEIFGISLFLIICGIATGLITYQGLVYSKKENEVVVRQKEENKELNLIRSIVGSLFAAIYLFISFTTNMWHVTWILWIIYAVVINIIELILELGDKKNGK